MSAPTALARAPGSAAAGHAALLGVQLAFGLFPVFGRTAMAPGGFDPFAVAAWRIAGGAGILGFAALLRYRAALWPPRAERARLLGLAVLGIVANQGLYLAGLVRSSAADAAVMMCTIPVFTFGAALLLATERFSLQRGLGVLVALLGVLPLVAGRSGTLGTEHLVGNLLLAANCLCYAFYLVLSKPLLAHQPALLLIARLYLISLPFLPLFLIGRSAWPAVESVRVYGALAYVVVFPTVVGYLLNIFALGRLRASTTALYIYLQPPIAACAGWWWLDEVPRRAALWSVLGLFLGAWLVTSDERTAARRAARGAHP